MILPRHPAIRFEFINQAMTKKELSSLIDVVYRNCGQKETVIFCDRLMKLGFANAFKAGISFGKDDLVIPKSKEKQVSETRKMIKQYEQQYEQHQQQNKQKHEQQQKQHNQQLFDLLMKIQLDLGV